MKAHRLAWTLFEGPVPDGQWVLHKCDNPPCVNTRHLFLGDRTDNMVDMANKGRQVFQQRPHQIKRGEAVHTARVSEDQAKEIIRRNKLGQSHRQIRDGMGLSINISAISHIASGRNWRHLER